LRLLFCTMQENLRLLNVFLKGNELDSSVIRKVMGNVRVGNT
jgi:hypothetical protein